MVIVRVPVVALLLAVNVSVLVPVAGLGLNAAVVPLPKPLADNVTAPVNPLLGVMVIVVEPWEDRVIVRLAGEAERLKLPAAAAFTVKDTPVVCTMPPPLPVTTIGYVPVAVVDATTMFIVELPEPGAAMLVGLNVMVTPVGAPLADKATAESKPPDTVVEIVELPLFPRTTVTELGEEDIAKSGLLVFPARALISPVPFGLPQPVTRSYPVTAEKLPDVPLVTS